MVTAEPMATERSVGELFGDLATETGTLVRQEIHLASRELSQKASHAGRSSIPIPATVWRP